MSASFAQLVPALLQRAQRLAAARLASADLARRDPARRWRKAALVWPLFGKD
jgi:hypothetical protein